LQEAYLKASRLWVHKNIAHVVLFVDAIARVLLNNKDCENNKKTTNKSINVVV
jgi:hypothetical protein